MVECPTRKIHKSLSTEKYKRMFLYQIATD